MSHLKNSNLVDVRNINLKQPRKNIYGKMWRGTTVLIIGVDDLRARMGTFTTPWSAPSNLLYSAPRLKFINDSLKDLLDRRALELLDSAKESGKRVMLLWSGGIDSTTVLSSIIKNWPSADLDLLTIVLNTNSIVENFNFYNKFISGKINFINYSNFDVNNEILNKNILIHGDPADCLYGPSVGAFRELLNSNQHLESYKKHYDKLIEMTQPKISSTHYIEGFGKWWVEKVTANIDEVRLDNIETVADWWWWTYYNFKWEFSCQRPFLFNRKNIKSGISIDNQEFFAKNTFYNTDYFQNWSYSNLKNHLCGGVESHKKEAKNYIFELDRNEFYLEKKTKMAGQPANALLRSTSELPLYYDANWVGHYHWEGDLDKESIYLLETYKG